MNAKLYRCGYCGMPTDSTGDPLPDDRFEKVKRIVERYGDRRTHLTHGACCPQEAEHEMRQVTHEMAMDAGDHNLEGQWIAWN